MSPQSMTRYRNVQQLSPTDAAYIAGIIDGEGSISLTRRHKNDNRQLVISIANTESALLEFIRDAVAAGRITKKRVVSDNHTPSLVYQIENRQAFDLLIQIAPFLKTYKAKRAKLVLDNYIELTPRNGKYSESIKKERESFIQQFMDIR